MSADVPDPRSFDNWEDAFQHPLPAVRGMERKLRTNIEETQQKLRTLVGGSYRNLLDTARTIIESHAEIREVDSKLVSVGQRCDSRVVERIGANSKALKQSLEEGHVPQYAFASQVAVLRESLNLASSLSKTSPSTLFPAKLLLLARVLHLTLRKNFPRVPLVDRLGHRLVSCRDRILRHTDRRLAQIYSDPSVLVENLAAYALATSSSPIAVLEHLQHVRLKAIKEEEESSKRPERKAVKHRIELYFGTIRDSLASFAGPLSALLNTIGSKRLIEDHDICNAELLSLDLHQQWFSNDVRNFTPYTRHEQKLLDSTKQSLKKWSKDAITALMNRVEADVKLETDLNALLETRKEALQAWSDAGHQARRLLPLSFLFDLRQIFVMRSKDLMDKAGEGLRIGVLKAFEGMLDSWNSNVEPRENLHLWSPKLLDMDLRKGGTSFRKAIVGTRYGKSDGVERVLKVFDEEGKAILNILTHLKDMHDTQWEDDIDADDDDDMSDDDRPRRSNPDEDSRELQRACQVSLKASIDGLNSNLSKAVHAHGLNFETKSAQAASVLRLVRALRRRVPALMETISGEAGAFGFCDDAVMEVHKNMANAVASCVTNSLESSYASFIGPERKVTELWEGMPAQPVQPTPAAFVFLKLVVKHMDNLGPDLWSPDAVDMLKTVLCETISTQYKTTVERLDERKHPVQIPNGHIAPTENKTSASVEDSEGQEDDVLAKKEDAQISESPEHTGEEFDTYAKENYVQLLFDAIYLEHAVRPSIKSRASDCGTVQTDLLSRTALDDSATAKLKKSAADYWRRSYLLFGLLSST